MDRMIAPNSKTASTEWFRPLTIEVVPPLQLMCGVLQVGRAGPCGCGQCSL